ncbi:hypothetical protein TURU_078905 [Turdus rufiventris]|nr:hypothetical protein TURU_078905 [Turdus rufiventris]
MMPQARATVLGTCATPRYQKPILPHIAGQLCRAVVPGAHAPPWRREAVPRCGAAGSPHSSPGSHFWVGKFRNFVHYIRPATKILDSAELRALQTPIKEGHGPAGESPEEGHEKTEALSCNERQRELELFGLEKRRLQEDLRAPSSSWKGYERAGLFTKVQLQATPLILCHPATREKRPAPTWLQPPDREL